MAQTEPFLTSGIILSDLVIREAGSNKLSLIGCFQRFNFPRFPAQTPLWFVTVGVTNLRGVITTLNVTARIEVADSGHVMSSSNAAIQLPPGSPPITPDAVFEIPLPFAGVVFQSAGKYSIVVLVDNEEVGRRPLEVIPLTQAASQ